MSPARAADVREPNVFRLSRCFTDPRRDSRPRLSSRAQLGSSQELSPAIISWRLESLYPATLALTPATTESRLTLKKREVLDEAKRSQNSNRDAGCGFHLPGTINSSWLDIRSED
jgi:hypothetical protein